MRLTSVKPQLEIKLHSRINIKCQAETEKKFGREILQVERREEEEEQDERQRIAKLQHEVKFQPQVEKPL